MLKYVQHMQHQMFCSTKPERNVVLLDNKQANKTSFQDVMHALLTPE